TDVLGAELWRQLHAPGDLLLGDLPRGRVVARETGLPVRLLNLPGQQGECPVPSSPLDGILFGRELRLAVQDRLTPLLVRLLSRLDPVPIYRGLAGGPQYRAGMAAQLLHSSIIVVRSSYSQRQTITLKL